MTDISKCANYMKCPLANTCRRVLDPDERNGWQSYANFYIENKKECDYYMPKKGEQHVEEVNHKIGQ